MLPGIRLATVEEINEIKDFSDLGMNTAVWVWPNDKGESDKAVIRQCTEIDPILFGANASVQRKMLFAWSTLNMMRVLGVQEVYFDVDAEGAEDYIEVLEKMGAQKTTVKPQFRFKLGL